jgi:hypothetical protein
LTGSGLLSAIPPFVDRLITKRCFRTSARKHKTVSSRGRFVSSPERDETIDQKRVISNAYKPKLYVQLKSFLRSQPPPESNIRLVHWLNRIVHWPIAAMTAGAGAATGDPR